MLLGFDFSFSLMGESIFCFSGQICWLDEPSGVRKSNEPMEQEFDGEHSSVIGSYVAYSNAVQDTVEVTVIEVEGLLKTFDKFGDQFRLAALILTIKNFYSRRQKMSMLMPKIFSVCVMRLLPHDSCRAVGL